MHSPASPAAASVPVASTAAGCVVSTAPATRSGDTKGVHELVPRSTSVSDVHSVVTRDDSMKSRKGGETRDRISRGTTHHAHASTSAPTHAAPKRSARPRWPWVVSSRMLALLEPLPLVEPVDITHHITATPSAAAVATALTAPIRATATADRHASRQSGYGDGLSASRARTTGISTHGASIIGSVSDEIEPRVVNTRGLSTKTSAASIREPGDPIRSNSASRTIPTNPTVSNTAHHRRCVIHGGMCASSPTAKNAPCGKK